MISINRFLADTSVLRTVARFGKRPKDGYSPWQCKNFVPCFSIAHLA